ncbi:MAG: beta-galactosidase [Planctomycetes bacterium]|nr:beta-galactosidase [Planctomycetota bacterium]
MPQRALLALTLACALGAAEPAAPPQGSTWGEEPVETVSATRQTVCLNGLWRFQPAAAADAAVPAEGWGLARVPGLFAFRPHHGIHMEGLVGRGQGPAWNGLERLNPHDEAWNRVEHAWYERPLAVPAGWAGRAIVLDLRRVCTDAAVFLDGRPAGALAWPGGELDLTALVRPGATHRLALRVSATAAEAESTEFMGTGANQTIQRRKPLESRGLPGDVLLHARPAGARVGDVFVQTSTARRRVELAVELAGVAQAGRVAFTARMLGPDGAAERTFAAAAEVAAAPLQTVRLGWDWDDARRWDLERPELYELRLAARGAGLDDEYAQTFGFREFRIEGRRLLLNDAELRLRPGVLGNTLDQHFGKRAEIDAAIDGLRAAGFNAQEFWPWDIDERGTAEWRDLWYERAMRKGWPVVASLATMAGQAAAWDAAARADWRRRLEPQVRRWRNNPAVIMWVHSPNLFTDWYDQDPRVAGHAEVMVARGEQGPRRAENAAARDANALLRGLDPTRPIINHAGGAAGDFQTVNFYPCLAQVQETEEWLSAWVRGGTGPYWPVEFGPFPPCDYRRGRNGGGWGLGRGAVYTEQLATEYLAAEYGARAYREETAETRATNPAKFESAQQYRQFNATPVTPLMQEHVAMQLRRSFRSWRTIGCTTLPIPWAFEQGWEKADGREALAPFRPGERGPWWPTAATWKLHFLRPQGGAALAWGRALIESNGPTLAWIAAPSDPADPAAFTAKDHAFAAGQQVAKQAALLNDTRAEQDWSLRWSATLDGRTIGGGEAAGRIAPATTAGAAIAFAIPADLAAPAAGAIELVARIGAAEHRDRFAFRAFPAPAPLGLALALWDPAGASAGLLRTLGCSVQAWDGRPGPGLVVVGRGALSGGATPPGDLEAHVRGGGRLLVLAQDPAWQRRRLGLRVGHQVVRRVFAVDPRHPLMDGLVDDDLADWAGHSTLVESHPAVTARELAPSGGPAYGWHWGNRGGVCSAMVEKPHLSGWRPLLEGDFACASTPLMELDLGAGRATWCTLDLEDHVPADAAARRLAANLLAHCARAALPGRAGAVAYCGGAEGARLLAALGATVAGRAALLVAGPGAERAAVEAHLAGGGTVLALDGAALGVPTTLVEDLGGSWEVPDQPWCAGLGLSDLHRRAPGPARVVAADAPGFTVAAGGQLAWRRAPGGGLLIVCGLDPLLLPADTRTYLRLTRWRQARALAQILANLGAGFASDARIFQRSADESLALDGPWSALLTQPLPPAARPGRHDPGMSATAAAALAGDPAGPGWRTLEVPGRWSAQGAPWRDVDGEALYRRTIDIPPALAGRELELRLGTIDDYDQTFLDGREIGATGATTREWWSAPRIYRIPAALAGAGRHQLAVRVFDGFGDGGFTGAPADLELRAVGREPPAWYWGDAVTTWVVADDPHRYCRW